jgi:hypothetical protein
MLALPDYIANLHPLLARPGVVHTVTGALKRSGVTDLATLPSLRPAEFADLLSLASDVADASDTSIALSPA